MPRPSPACLSLPSAGPWPGTRAGHIEPPAELNPTPTAWRFTSETLKLPGGENMGMVAGDLLFDVSDKLRLRVGSYGAVQGDRGDFKANVAGLTLAYQFTGFVAK